MDILLTSLQNCFRQSISRVCVFYITILLFGSVTVLAKDCLGRDQCSCAFDDDGSLIVLNSLGNSDLTPR